VTPPKPSKPAPPPPPLSKEAITGSVPLRSFGQLKQLFDTRSKEEIDADNAAKSAPEGGETPPANPAS
jgi:uncharacterized protein